MIRKRDIGHQGTLGVVSFFRFFPATFRLTSGENNTVLANQGLSHSPEGLIRVPTSARVPSKPWKRHADALVSTGNYNARRSINVSVPWVGSMLRRNRGGQAGVFGLPLFLSLPLLGRPTKSVGYPVFLA